jgi:prepilin-type N-terminal cleavage/methylation domain-containing protein
MRRLSKAFTLVELLVAISILLLLTLTVARLFDAASSATTASNKHIETDAEARPVLDRFAIDIAQIVKRSEIDYFFKSPASPQVASGLVPGNDQLAFFSQVSGYYPSTGSQSPLSLVAYRINSDSTSRAFNRMERLGKGLLWNGVSPTSAPIVFLPLQISSMWPASINSTPDPQGDYEIIGPTVFRFEYYYLLKNGSFSTTPWDTSTGHSGINGLRDVAAIIVGLAAIDRKSSELISSTQLSALAVNMPDYTATMQPGDLMGQWQSALDSNSVTPPIPRGALSAIRLYERYFYLP